MQWNRRIAKADACRFIQIQKFVCLQNHWGANALVGTWLVTAFAVTLYNELNTLRQL